MLAEQILIAAMNARDAEGRHVAVWPDHTQAEGAAVKAISKILESQGPHAIIVDDMVETRA
jgi:phosphoribosylpyrophosphate synthetase